MRIGIDISQIVYEGTGVGTYVRKLVTELIRRDTKNSYILFGATLRQRAKLLSFYNSLPCDRKRVRLCIIPIPPTVLDILWNTFHIIPIEWFTGTIDVFWSSDWTQPPLLHARGVTTVHDLSILRYPESFNKKILSVQTRRLHRIKQECDAFLCDSIATQQDIVKLLDIDKQKTHVVYPGF